ncbi:Swt1 family HEPN domain-containing protein [Glaciecola sp. 2405UD65-10]|uniref:Swt1 family HEPN domain-containing protein n=1 Tax=Glaciecola sp. 2405UD65-10 TaxID=3397244 RepID=UPI003B5AB8D6
MFSELEKIAEVDESSLILYARLWQLEKWLREMVYVELKAKKGRSWFNFNKTKKTYESDKSVTHIPTSNDNPLSFTTFTELIKLIQNNWDLFSEYLPPKCIWEVKLEEIVHIRNRVAHFRSGHTDDIERLLQLMRDIDNGFWKFCTDYNNLQPVVPPDKDIVAKAYVDLNPFSFKEVAPNEWAQIGSAPPDLRYIVSISSQRRRWAEKSVVIDGTPGYIYDLSIHLRDNRQFEYSKFLAETTRYKAEIIHICLDTFSSTVRVTIPAILGSEKVCKIIDGLINITEHSITIHRPTNSDDNSVQKLSEEWPEYVLGPKNPLTFLGPDMPCSFFNVIKSS